MSLLNIILHLIDQKQEGDYWDFKLKHHENKVDLVLDIICMANNLADRDSYIIFGINDKTYELIGINNDSNRRNQQCVIDILKGVEFLGHVRPKIELKTINYVDKEIDVLVIKNTSKTPYYLKSKYPNKMTQRFIRANHIYTRINDTNTPINESADIDIVEYLWRKRFGYDKPPLERLKLLLLDYQNWIKDFGNINYCFHEIHPEFRIEISSQRTGYEACASFYLDTDIEVYDMKVYYHSTILHESKMVAFDGYRLFLPDMKNGRINGYEKGFYYYYDMASVNGHILYMLTDGTLKTNARYKEDGHFLFFESDEERQKFDEDAMIAIDVIHALEPSFEAKQAMERHERKNKLMAYDVLFMNKLYQYYIRWKE